MRLSTPCVRKLRGKGTRHHGRLLRRNLLRARRPESQHVRCDAFSGKNTGFLGYIQNANIHFYNSSDRVHSTAAEFDVSGIEKLPKVGVLYSTRRHRRGAHRCHARPRRKGERPVQRRSGRNKPGHRGQAWRGQRRQCPSYLLLAHSGRPHRRLQRPRRHSTFIARGSG